MERWRDKGTRGQGDKEEGRIFSLSPPPIVPLSHCPIVSPSLHLCGLCYLCGKFFRVSIARRLSPELTTVV